MAGFLERSKDVASNVGAVARKQAKRAQLELEMKRTTSRINRQYQAIGKALYPQLAAGGPGSDDPDVQAAVSELGQLNDDLENKKAQVEELLRSAEEDTDTVVELLEGESPEEDRNDTA